MLIPERTQRVHKFVLPFFVIRLGMVLFSLAVVFLVILGVDYIHVLGHISENKQLKGENFKLRQEIQLIRNKVETMESTIERVRNYAKKLQMLTGQGEKAGELPWGPVEGATGLESERAEVREPASEKDRHSEWREPAAEGNDPMSYLSRRVEELQLVSVQTETGLSRLQTSMLKQSAIMAATPTLLPINGWISSAFGYRRNPYDGSYKLHAGIDIAAEPGTPVRAPADGMIVFSGYREGYGKVVVINHGYGISTLFAHNSKLFVNTGSRTKRGEVLAEVGNTGHSTGPHCHYEIRKNGVPVNPAAFLARTRF